MGKSWFGCSVYNVYYYSVSEKNNKQRLTIARHRFSLAAVPLKLQLHCRFHTVLITCTVHILLKDFGLLFTPHSKTADTERGGIIWFDLANQVCTYLENSFNCYVFSSYGDHTECITVFPCKRRSISKQRLYSYFTIC